MKKKVVEKTKDEIILEALQAFYLKEENNAINKLAKKISVVNTVEKNVEYTAVEGYYEVRKMYNTRKPSRFVKVNSDKKIDASAYDKWSLKLGSYVNAFSEQKKMYTIGESKFLEKCQRCNGSGTQKCSVCHYGKQRCSSCNGEGRFFCYKCMGLGIYYCPICGGRGYTIWYDDYPDGRGGYYTKEEIIYCSCGGRIECDDCGGTGSHRCNKCDGSGETTCSICYGTLVESCGNCYGNAYFINQVDLEQKYDTVYSYIVINGYNIDTEKYGTQKFNAINICEKDICTYEFISDEIIEHTPHTNLARANQTLMNKAIEKGAKSILKYRAREFKREVVEVEYNIKGRTFNSIIDLSTGQVITDKNPYEVFKIKNKPTKKKKEKKVKETKKKKIHINLKIIITLIIAVACVWPLYFPFICEIISRREWVALVACLLTLIIPMSKLYQMYQDLDSARFKIFVFIKMLIVVGLISIVTNMIFQALFYFILDRMGRL